MLYYLHNKLIYISNCDINFFFNKKLFVLLKFVEEKYLTFEKQNKKLFRHGFILAAFLRNGIVFLAVIYAQASTIISVLTPLTSYV